MSEYLFDPGYGRHLSSLVFSLEDIYGNINKFKNLGQKKFQFKQYYPSILKLVKQNTAFYLGCLLWAVYLKSQPVGEIINNYCLGKEYNEDSSLVELLFLIRFAKTFSKDTKYYMNTDYKYPDEDLKMLGIYKDFAQINQGFVNTKTNNDLKLPDSIKTPSDKDLQSIKSTIDETVKTGDFDKLFEIRGLIL